MRTCFFAISLVMTLASCRKILDLKPTHQLEGQERFNTIEDYDFALTGAYSLFRSNYYYGAKGGSNSFVTLPDILSDNFNETTQSLGNFRAITNWTFAADDVNIDSTWQAAYRIIAQANIVLRGLDKFSEKHPGAVNRIKGQALAIRALVHFDILRYWAPEFERNSSKPGIPYMLEFNFEVKPGRGTVKETYDRIESDLLQAAELLTKSDRTINVNGRAYIDTIVVNAIFARMYLYSKQYDRAASYAGRVIKTIPLAKFESFSGIWTDESTAEVIWSVVFNAGEGAIADNIFFTSLNTSSYEPNPVLVDTFNQAADVRYASYFQHVPDKYGNVRLVLSKYLAKTSQLSRPDGVVNFKSFRTGEMYLISAEANAYSAAGLVQALGDLDSLRKARIKGFVSGNESDSSALLKAIDLERRKELIGEGHRWFDLKRTKKEINRGSGCTNVCTLIEPARSWVWPIPFSEIKANPNMTQNPGY